MIARPIHRAKPIPFSCPQKGYSAAGAGWPAPKQAAFTGLRAAEPFKGDGPDAWTASLGMLASAQRPERHQPIANTQGKCTEPRTSAPRQSTARYDGPHSLTIRSATSGRQYRFDHPGATQVIDAIDITLMRRIEDITLL